MKVLKQPFLISALLLGLSSTLFAQSVPNGKLLRTEGDEKDYETKAGTIVEFEFDSKDVFEEASGDNAVKGDEFIAHEGNMSLKEVTDLLVSKDIKVRGDWNYEKSFRYGWVYELEGVKDSKKMEYLISAKDGEILKEEVDD